MPENKCTRSSPKKLPAAFTEQGVWHLHKKYTQSFPSPPAKHVLGPEVLPHPTAHRSLGGFSTSPLTLVLFAEAVAQGLRC